MCQESVTIYQNNRKFQKLFGNFLIHVKRIVKCRQKCICVSLLLSQIGHIIYTRSTWSKSKRRTARVLLPEICEPKQECQGGCFQKIPLPFWSRCLANENKVRYLGEIISRSLAFSNWAKLVEPRPHGSFENRSHLLFKKCSHQGLWYSGFPGYKKSLINNFPHALLTADIFPVLVKNTRSRSRDPAYQ